MENQLNIAINAHINKPIIIGDNSNPMIAAKATGDFTAVRLSRNRKIKNPIAQEMRRAIPISV